MKGHGISACEEISCSGKKCQGTAWQLAENRSEAQEVSGHDFSRAEKLCKLTPALAAAGLFPRPIPQLVDSSITT